MTRAIYDYRAGEHAPIGYKQAISVNLNGNEILYASEDDRGIRVGSSSCLMVNGELALEQARACYNALKILFDNREDNEIL